MKEREKKVLTSAATLGLIVASIIGCSGLEDTKTGIKVNTPTVTSVPLSAREPLPTPQKGKK